jgi:hypothetical protein
MSSFAELKAQSDALAQQIVGLGQAMKACKATGGDMADVAAQMAALKVEKKALDKAAKKIKPKSTQSTGKL